VRIRQPSRDQLLAYGLLALPVVVVFACFAPGHMGIDSFSQIGEVDKGAFTNRHATLLLALWYPLFHLGLGPAFVLAVQIAVFALGSYLVLRPAFGRVAAAAVVLGICLWPPVFGMLGSVGRDTWFAALMVATYGLLVRSAEREWPARGRWLVLATIALWLAIASRQNAFVAMIPAAVMLAAMTLTRVRETRDGGRGGARPRLAALVAGLALVGGILVSQLAGTLAMRADDVDPEQYLYIYDLAALSERDGVNRFPAAVVEGDVEPIERGFYPDSMVDLVYYQPPVVAAPLDEARMRSLRDAWLDRIGSDPGGYLAVRADLFGRQLALTRSARNVLIPELIANEYGYEILLGGPHDAALDYLDLFTEPHPESFFFASTDGDVLYTVWVYLLAAAAAAAYLLRRGVAAELRVVGALALGALTLQIGLFFLAMGTEYRFEFPAVAASGLAAAVAIRVALRSRTSARTPAGSAAPPTPSP
jgi:hypothetical protein